MFILTLEQDCTYGATRIRGSDYGGGIGGVLYTKDAAGIATYNHYNARGDVTAKTDESGTPLYIAQYEAFGQHGTTEGTEEWGTNPNRQQANTKDEDPTGLLNEGFRYRYYDPVTGVFMTRDPLGFVDGPNMYTYVVQNPWTKFDPLGLYAEVSTRTEKSGGIGGFFQKETTVVDIVVRVAYINKSSQEVTPSDTAKLSQSIADKWSGGFTSSGGRDYRVNVDVQTMGPDDIPYEAGDEMLSPETLAGKYEFNIVEFVDHDGGTVTGTTGGGPSQNDITISVDSGTKTVGSDEVARTTQHEMGHAMGHPDKPSWDGNLMKSKNRGNRLDHTQVNGNNIEVILGGNFSPFKDKNNKAARDRYSAGMQEADQQYSGRTKADHDNWLDTIVEDADDE